MPTVDVTAPTVGPAADATVPTVDVTVPATGPAVDVTAPTADPTVPAAEVTSWLALPLPRPRSRWPSG